MASDKGFRQSDLSLNHATRSAISSVSWLSSPVATDPDLPGDPSRSPADFAVALNGSAAVISAQPLLNPPRAAYKDDKQGCS